MDTLLLSRIQFGISVGFHYLFPIATLGLMFMIMLFETLFIVRKNTRHRDVSSFLIALLGPVFTMGVATGLVMPFAFGTNWERFSAFAGAFFGSALSIEAMAAFAFESLFIALLLYGRRRVGPRVYWFVALGVFITSHLSAFLIVAANSWMQTPAGFTIENGRIIVTSFTAAIFNPSAIIGYVHVITAAWLAGTFIAAGIAAFYLTKQRHTGYAESILRVTLPLMLALAVFQPLWGHFNIMVVHRFNPEKNAAYEGIFHTVKGAPLYMFGIPDSKNERIVMGVGLPWGLSLLESGNPLSEVRGLTEYPREDWPPVGVVFTTFHLMVMAGMVMLAIAAVGVVVLRRKQLGNARWFLRVLPWCVPLPFIANELGWIGAEIGRQPWIIYKVLRTADAAGTHLPVWQVGVSLAGVCVVYILLTILTVWFVRRVVRHAPGFTS